MLTTETGATTGTVEDRTEPRVSADLIGVLVESPEKGTLEMPGRDISLHGMCLEPGRWTVKMLWPDGQPEPGATLDIQLLVPRMPGMSDYEIDVHCRVMRLVRLCERRYEVGLAFLEIAPGCREALAAYVNSHQGEPFLMQHH